MQVIWSPRSLDDLEEIASYLHERNALAAERISGCIWDRATELGMVPRLGEEIPHTAFRRLLIPRTPYFVVYRIACGQVQIAYVRHTRSREPELD